MFVRLLVSSLILWSSNTALACAVCGSQDEKSAGTYLVMTIFLSTLPLSLIGGIGYMFWRAAKSAAAKDAEKAEAWRDLTLYTQIPEDMPVLLAIHPSSFRSIGSCKRSSATPGCIIWAPMSNSNNIDAVKSI